MGHHRGARAVRGRAQAPRRRWRTARPTAAGASTPCSSSPRSSSRWAATPSTSRRSRPSARSSRPPPIPHVGPPGTAGPGFSTASPAPGPRFPSPSAGRPSRSPRRGGFPELRAFAECCLTHVYVVSGDLREAHRGGGTRARRVRGPSQRVVGVPDAVRPQHGRQRAGRMAARSRRTVAACVEYGRDLDDLRLKVVGLWRTRLDPHPAGRHRAGPALLRGRARPVARRLRCRDDEGDAGLRSHQARGRRRGRGAARGGRRVVPAVEPRVHPRLLRAVARRGVPASGAPAPKPERCWRTCSRRLATVDTAHVEGVATRLLARSLHGGRPRGGGRAFRERRRLCSTASERGTRWPRRWRSRRHSGGPPEIGPARRRCWRARSRSSKRLERSTRSTGCARARTR